MTVFDNCRKILDLGRADLPQSIGDDGYVRFKDKLRLPGSSSLHVTTVREAIYPDSYAYVLDFLEITLGATITVLAPERFTCHVIFGARGESTPPQGSTWSHPGAHLPGQYARIVWQHMQPHPAS